MKPLCLLFTILLGFLTSFNVRAQEISESNTTKNDLVLEIPRADLYKVLPLLKTKFKQINGVSFEGYCDSRKLLFVKANEEAFFNVLMAIKELNLVYYIKQNTSIERARKICLNEDEIKVSLSND